MESMLARDTRCAKHIQAWPAKCQVAQVAQAAATRCLSSSEDVADEGSMRKETSKTRYGTQRPAQGRESICFKAAKTHSAEASVAA